MAIDKQKQKEIGRKYAQTHRMMGVYQIKNMANGKILIGSAMNLHGVLNREPFTLNFGNHPNKDLQQDWNKYGEDHFSFEILEKIKPKDEYVQGPEEREKYRKDLEAMEEMWLEELQPYGKRGYNKNSKAGI